MTEPKLKPCPFCGGEARPDFGTGDGVECSECFANIWEDTAPGISQRMWNRRVPAPTAWQPIKTAPKDGRRVLLTDGSDVTIGGWDGEGKYSWKDEGPGWWTEGCFPGPWTHWAPLPALPGKAGG